MGNMGSGGGCGCGDNSKKPANAGNAKTGSCTPPPNAQPKTGNMGATTPNPNAAKK